MKFHYFGTSSDFVLTVLGYLSGSPGTENETVGGRCNSRCKEAIEGVVL